MISPPPTAMPCCEYYRMSTLDQDDSISQQQREVAKLRKQHQYNTRHQFIDEGWSGDDDYRPHFQEMLTQIERSDNPFRVILCWDLDRFSRANPLEVLSQFNLLRKAGVNVHTCQQGYFDLQQVDIAQLVILAVESEQNHKYLQKLAVGTSRGMLSAFRAGKWTGGDAPYGFVLEDQRLVPVDREVELVREIFHWFVNLRLAYGQIADRLNARRIPSPRGKKWHRNTIKKMLANEIYIGDRRISKNWTGKHAKIQNGEITKLAGDELQKIAAEKEKIMQRRVKDAKIGLERKTKPRVCRQNSEDEGNYQVGFLDYQVVTPEIFCVARERIAQIREEKFRPKKGAMPLTGIACCGHCGHKLSGLDTSSRRTLANGTEKVYRRYVYRCCGAQNTGSHHNYSVSADLLHSVVAMKIRQCCLNPRAIERLVDDLRRQFEQPSAADDPERLQAQIRAIRNEIRRQQDRATRAPETIWSAIDREIRKQEGLLRDAEQRLQAAKRRAGSSVAASEYSRRVAAYLGDLGEQFASCDPRRLREEFQRILGRVTIWAAPGTLSPERRQKEGRTESRRWQLDRGEIEVRLSVPTENYGSPYAPLPTIVLPFDASDVACAA